MSLGSSVFAGLGLTVVVNTHTHRYRTNHATLRPVYNSPHLALLTVLATGAKAL